MKDFDDLSPPIMESIHDKPCSTTTKKELGRDLLQQRLQLIYSSMYTLMQLRKSMARKSPIHALYNKNKTALALRATCSLECDNSKVK